MDHDKKHFLATYARAIRLGEATAFVGSGLSRPAGYPDWMGLAASMAVLLGLEVGEEAHDLPALMQFFVTADGSHRGRLNDILRGHFLEEKPVPAAMAALVRLRLREIWTTNYETLIERAHRASGRTVEVRSSDAQLTLQGHFATTAVFKMHGTIEQPDSCVVTRDDYESYRRTRPAFYHTLAERLQSKQFLFLGAGLNDPNLMTVLSLMREMHGPHTRTHYALIRRGSHDGDDGERRAYRRALLWHQELKRYGIQPVYYKEHDEIPEILEDVRREILRGVVFVGGSHPEKGDSQPVLSTFCRNLGVDLARRRLSVVSGFGLTVGSALVSGVLEELYSMRMTGVDQALSLQPFPQHLDPDEQDGVYAVYRKDMVEKAGVAIFVGGTRPNGELSQGVLDEFEIALRNGALPVPIGAFGGAAREIWQRVSQDVGRLLPGVHREDFEALNDDGPSPRELLAAVGRIIATRVDSGA